MMDEGMTPEDILEHLLGTLDLKITEKMPVRYHCGCSKEKIHALIAAMPAEEIQSMIDENHGAEADCRFCNKHYSFTEDELKAMLAKKS